MSSYTRCPGLRCGDLNLRMVCLQIRLYLILTDRWIVICQRKPKARHTLLGRQGSIHHAAARSRLCGAGSKEKCSGQGPQINIFLIVEIYLRSWHNIRARCFREKQVYPSSADERCAATIGYVKAIASIVIIEAHATIRYQVHSTLGYYDQRVPQWSRRHIANKAHITWYNVMYPHSEWCEAGQKCTSAESCLDKPPLWAIRVDFEIPSSSKNKRLVVILQSDEMCKYEEGTYSNQWKVVLRKLGDL